MFLLFIVAQAPNQNVVTLSQESVDALATAIEEIRKGEKFCKLVIHADLYLSNLARSSVIPTPVEPFEEKVEDLEVVGTRMELLRKSKARADAKRYLKLFKKHITAFDPSYSVKTTLTTVTIQKSSFGSSEEKGVFDYKVGVVKKLYMVLLSLPNVDQFVEWLKNNELTPFNDNEYRYSTS